MLSCLRAALLRFVFGDPSLGRVSSYSSPVWLQAGPPQTHAPRAFTFSVAWTPAVPLVHRGQPTYRAAHLLAEQGA